MVLPKLLLIDKPKGISSFGIIHQLRRKIGIRKFGHAGTLDPLATGLMLIGVQDGTKLLSELIGLDKEYEAKIIIGERRLTGDMEGEILAEKEYKEDITTEEIEKVLKNLCGEIELPVSVYSAIRKDGVPLYKKARAAARKGQIFTDAPTRKMKVYEAVLQSTEVITLAGKKRLLLSVRFFVGSGTYIRSLVEEVGRQLNYPATLYELRRTKVGKYTVEQAWKLENINNETFVVPSPTQMG